MAPDQIDGALHEIASMVEFLHREMEKLVCDDKTNLFSIPYDDMNLIDFALEGVRQGHFLALYIRLVIRKASAALGLRTVAISRQTRSSRNP